MRGGEATVARSRKWSGKCASGKHGLDYRGQPCDLCPRTIAPTRTLVGEWWEVHEPYGAQWTASAKLGGRGSAGARASVIRSHGGECKVVHVRRYRGQR